MDGLDATIRSVLEAASIDEEALKTINREDLKDLFPGPEHFLQRKKLWECINETRKRASDQTPNTSRSSSSASDALPSPSVASPLQPECSTPSPVVGKTVKLPDAPEYVIYTDTELEMVRSQYFSLLRNGNVKDFTMSKELCCRLVRNTITSMVALLRASPLGKEIKYPSKLEMTKMSQKIVSYYPMLRDPDPDMAYLSIYRKMYKRLQNMKSPKKRQGPIPQRGKAKKTLFVSDITDDGTEGDISGDNSCDTSGDTSDSRASTILLESHDELSEDSQKAEKVSQPRRSHSAASSSSSVSASSSSPKPVAVPQTTLPDDNTNLDSLKMQARHYRTLSNMYKNPNAKPNPSDVVQVLNLEFKARRAFIDADVTREEDRPTKIFEAYPCFKEITHAMDELARIVGGGNHKFIEEMRARWSSFCDKVHLFGIWKKALKPPLATDKCGADFMITLINVLPTLFPSPALPPKRLGNASEALIHVLKPHEDPALYLGKRPLSCPVLLFDEATCIVAVGDIPVSNLPKEDVRDGLLVLMAYYYTLHLTYPKCVATRGGRYDLKFILRYNLIGRR